VAARRKALVVLKLGRSELGRRATLAHTGTLAGRHEAFAALFRQNGVALVDSVNALVETAALLELAPLPLGDGLVSLYWGLPVREFAAVRDRGLEPLKREILALAPEAAPVLDFIHDFEQFLFTTYAESVKGRGLRRNTQVAASVDDPAPPYSFVIIEGAAQLSDRLEDVRAAATRIGGRYMGEGRAAEFGARNGVPGELLIRLIPARIIAQRAVSG